MLVWHVDIGNKLGVKAHVIALGKQQRRAEHFHC